MNRWAVLLGLCLLSIVGAAQPAITSFSPTSAVTGSAVTITGSGFNTTSSANIVYFGATKAAISSASATELVVTVPAGASFAPITVLNTASGLLAYSSHSFLPTFAGAGANASFVYSAITDVSTSGNTLPIKAQLGDFDGDGKPDMAAVISNGKVAVYPNNSVIRKISFTAPSFFGTGSTPNDIAIADMNGDGKLDMVTSNTGDNTVSVFINTSTTGSISFNPKQDFATGSNPASIAIQDLDGDGRPDVVVTNNVSNTISLLRNATTGGTFSLATKIDLVTGTLPNSIAITDIDGDQKPDIAVSNQQSSSVSVFYNTSSPGNLSFSAASTLSVNAAVKVAFADFNGNGKEDLAAISSGAIAPLLFDNTSTTGNISFATGVSGANTISSELSMVIHDFSGDGKPDIATLNSNGGSGPGGSGYGSATVTTNNSNGSNLSFAAQTFGVSTGTNPKSISAGDIDGDGKPDLIIPSQNAAITVYRNTTTSILPVITSIAPLSVATGDIFTITGSNFEDVFDVMLGNNVPNIQVLSPTTIRVTVGVATAGSLTVTVLGPAGMASMGGLTYYAIPTISSFNPTSGIAGSVLTITGTDFTNVTAVRINGTNVASFSVLSPTAIRAVVGANSSGTVSVQTAGGIGALAGFVYGTPPTISSFTPLLAGAGQAITITGANFTSVTSVTLGGTALASFNVLTTTTIVGTIGGGSSGTLVVNAAAGAGSLGGFTFIPAPTITSFTPTSAISGTTLTVTGTNFANIASVRLGITAAASFNVLSSTMMLVKVGAGSSGSLSISTGGGTATLAGFTYISTTPTISSFTPTSAATGQIITITGTNFTGVTSVTLGGAAAASFNVLSATQIVAVVGTGASGSLTVTNATASGGLEGFTFLSATPTSISSFTPSSGAMGSIITINGNNFSAAIPDNLVYFTGAVRGTIVSASATELKVLVPAGANFGPIAVLNKGMRSTAYSTDYFVPTFAGGGGNFSLTGATNITTGAGPYQVILADVNDDGKQDMVVINKTDNNVSVYRNTTVGKTISFDTRINYATGLMPQGLALADLNGDGMQDIITANFSSNNLSILLNNGTPGAVISFLNKVDIPAGVSGVGVQSVAVSDLDGDGRPDLVVTNNLTSNISVYRNLCHDNTVVFARTEFATANNPIGLCIADLDGDGKPDIAVAGSNGTSMLRNTSTLGVISFAPKVDYSISTVSVAVVPTDQNGDGKIDLLVYKTGTNPMEPLRNVGNTGYIAFASTQLSSTGNNNLSYPYGYASSDLDGDGKLDIVYPNTSSSTIHFSKNRTVSPNSPSYLVSTFTNLTSGLSIATGDIDGDGKLDIVTCKGPDNTGITAYLNNTLAAPLITSVTPLSGTIGDVLTVTGSLFNNIIDVKLGATAVGSFNVISPTLMTVTVGNGSTGTLSITGITGTGAFTGFTFVPPVLPPPTITSFTPTSGVRGTTISITGTNLTWTTDVNIGGNPANSFSVVSSTNVLAFVNSGGASGAITVTTASGSAGKAGFVFIPQPIVTSIYPNNGSPSTVFTITGSNFVDVQKVEIGTYQVGSFKVVSPEIIVATVGNNVQGVGNPGGGSGGVKVTSATGSNQVSLPFYFILTQPMPPVIYSVTPLQAKPGSLDTIKGLYLSNADVNYGGVKAQVQSVSDTIIIVKVPPYAPYDYIYASDRVSHLTAYSPQKFIPIFKGATGILAKDFSERWNFTTGSQVKDLLVSDFDGDGKPDVATVGDVSGMVSVFRNTSSGDSIRFDQRKDFVSGNGAFHIAYADFDGDGRQDLVAINKNETGNASVSVFRNTSTPGSISFTNKINLVVPTNMPDVFSVGVGDHNKDGKPDIFVMSSMGMVTFKNSSPLVDSILFIAPTSVQSGLTNLSAFDLLHIADISADGQMDYIGVSSWRPYVSAFRNNNNITSSSTMTQTDLATYSQPSWITTGDVDNDGKNDIITASRLGNKVSVLRNTNININIPFFDTNIDFATGASPSSVSLGDLNGDGNLDMIIPGLSDAGLLLLKNTGTTAIAFSAATSITGVSNAYLTVAADLNGDGKPEIISGTSTGIAVFRNTMDSLAAPTITSFAPTSATTGNIITITGTGFTGVTTVTLGGTNVASFKVLSPTTLTAVVGIGASGTLTVTSAGGSAGLSGFTYAPPVPPSIASFFPISGPAGTTVTLSGSSFNADLSKNIVFFGATRATVISVSLSELKVIAPVGATLQQISVLNTDNRLTGFSSDPFLETFATQKELASQTDFDPKVDLTAGIAIRTVAISDLDGDGKSDLVALNYGAGGLGGISIFRNISTPGSITGGSFASKLDLFTGGNPYELIVRDMNGDGKPDLIVSNTQNVMLFRNTSTAGSISFAASFNISTGSYYNIAVGDLDKDGWPDIVVPTGPYMEIYRNLGTIGAFTSSSFAPAVTVATIGGIQSNDIAIADLDSDGRPEIVYAQGSNVSVFRNNIDFYGISSGSFAGRVDFPIGANAWKLVVGDIDGDRKPEIAVVCDGSAHTVAILRNTTTRGIINASSFAPKTSMTGGKTELDDLALGDLDGDTKPELVVLSNFGIPANVFRNISTSGSSDTSFTPVIEFTTAGSPIAGAIGDLDGDGKPDLVTSNREGTNNSLSVFRNNLAVIGGPTITGFSPTSAAKGATITITGTNLSGVLSATLGGTAVATIKALSSTTATVVVGDGASGALVLYTSSASISKDGFVYLPASVIPTISSFTPTTAGIGATITVTGANLSGVLSATLGGTAVASFKTISSTLVTLTVGSGSSGTLSLTTASGSATVTGFVYMAPVTITSGGALCAGGAVTLTSSAATGNQWYRNDQPITGATTGSYVASTTGTYYTVVTVEGVGYKSNVLTLSSSPRPMAAFSTGSNANQCLTGNAYNFNNGSTITGTNTSIVSRQWSFGDGQGSDLNNASHSYTKPGRYEVKLVVRSNEGCTDSLSLFFTVQAPPALTVQNPAPVCSPGTVTITNAASASGLPLTYWRDSLATIALANPSALTASGTYYIKGTDTSSCPAIQPVTVVVNPLPSVAAIAGDASVCTNAKIVLTNTTAGGIWSSTNSGVLTIDALGTVTPVNAGTATVTYTYTNPATGCSGSVSKLITVNSLPLAGKPALLNYPNDTLVCFFAGTTFSSKNTYDKYLWSTGETTSTIQVSNNATVSLKVGSNLTPCYSESSVVITARKNLTPQPTITRQGDDLLSSSSATYKWLFNNSPTGDTLNRVTISQRGIYNISTSVDRVCWNTSNDYLVFLDPVVVKRSFELTAYPNPTNGPFNLQLKFDRNTTAVIKITIVDQGGTTKWSGKKLIFMDKSIKISINTSLAKGTYTIKVDVNGEINTQQLIVM